jgi:hypothetical protein
MIYVITLMIVGSFYFLSLFVRSPATNMLRARTHARAAPRTFLSNAPSHR